MNFNPKLTLYAALLVVLAGFPTAAAAYSDFTTESLLASFFPGRSTSQVVWKPSVAERDRFKSKVGYFPPVAEYTWFVDSVGGTPAGYALVDEQLGQHEPITFGVQLLPDASIVRIEVMVYREAYGEGVRAEGFRRQFVGLAFLNPMRAGKEIKIVSGATISSRSLSTGARRASALLATWLGE